MNNYLFHLLNDLAGRNSLSDEAIVFFASSFGLVILGGLLVFLFRHKDVPRGARDTVVVLSAAVCAWGLALFFKWLFAEPRPFLALSDVHLVITPGVLDGGGSSFPSGHTAFFASIAGSLYFYHKRIAVFFALAAFLVGLARVTAGIHWPVDILGGYILGFAIGMGAYALFTLSAQKLPRSEKLH